MRKEQRMQMEQDSKSPNWLAGSSIPLGFDPLLELMRQQQIPLTRENYLRLAYPEGVPDPWPAELEETLPPEIRDLPLV